MPQSASNSEEHSQHGHDEQGDDDWGAPPDDDDHEEMNVDIQAPQPVEVEDIDIDGTSNQITVVSSRRGQKGQRRERE